MHISVPMANTIQFIDATTISPLITHTNVKVCYVGQQENRNDTVITKEVAVEMGKKLPGSPVVGFYNEDKQDFEGHERRLDIKDGKFKLIDITKPYGFVPTNAKVWFQTFNDEGVSHEYLCTECYIWTSAYPESQRVINKGNNQSMELSQDYQSGFWTNGNNSDHRIFIYNEALIEKLCILGEDVEPCFEGAQFKTQFSLESELIQNLFSMIQETLDKGGSQMEENKDQFEKETDKEKETAKEAPEKIVDDDEKKKEEHACGGGGSSSDTKKKKKEYSLDEIPEYVELKNQYDTLQNEYSALQTEKATLDAELTSLREFKAVTDRQNKQAMIDSFYMLSDEDKKDCIENIDNYSLKDIEANLSIICVKNKVDFNLGKQEEQSPVGLFNLEDPDDGVPAWIKAVRENSK